MITRTPARRRLASAAESARALMVRQHLVARGIVSPAVLHAMARIPREEFVPPELREQAYADGPLPLASGQTISQPYVVARMSEELRLAPGDRVLDVGTGSGYQAAVLAAMGARVISLERDAGLHATARDTLSRLGFDGVELHHADGRLGYPPGAPYAAILVAAAADAPPPALLEQLAEGGRLVMPLRDAAGAETLVCLQRHGDAFSQARLLPVRFVPLQDGLA